MVISIECFVYCPLLIIFPNNSMYKNHQCYITWYFLMFSIFKFWDCVLQLRKIMLVSHYTCFIKYCINWGGGDAFNKSYIWITSYYLSICSSWSMSGLKLTNWTKLWQKTSAFIDCSTYSTFGWSNVQHTDKKVIK